MAASRSMVARETEIRRDCGRELAGARAEVAKLRAAASWARRIAEDEVECRWREKTEVLLIEVARLRSAQAVMGNQLLSTQEALQDKEDECMLLRAKVRRLEQVEHTMNRLQARWAAVEQRDLEETRHLERQQKVGCAIHPHRHQRSYSYRHQRRQRSFKAGKTASGGGLFVVHDYDDNDDDDDEEADDSDHELCRVQRKQTRKKVVVEYDANGRRKR